MEKEKSSGWPREVRLKRKKRKFHRPSNPLSKAPFSVLLIGGEKEI